MKKLTSCAISLIGLIVICIFYSCNSQNSVLINKNINYSQKVNSVAVMNFNNSADANSVQLSEALTGFMISELAGIPQIKVLERKELNKLLSETGLQLSGLVDEKTAVQAGKMIGAHYLVLGSIISVRNKIMINARLVSVETTEILVSAAVKGDNDKGLDLVEELSGELSNAIRKFAKDN